MSSPLCRLSLLVLLLPIVAQAQVEQEDPCPPKLDVAFVMDTSGSIELVYAEHVKWTMALAEILPIRQDAVRLAVIQYASYPLTEFSLSTYSSADNVRKHLQQITFQAGVTRTGYALRKAESELFREDKGARSDADKLLILFSDGLSIDDPIKVSETLRNEKNVTLYVVSVGSEGFATEMERIAGTHDDTYGPKDLAKLKAHVIKRVEGARVCQNGERLSSLTTSSTSTTTTTTTTTTTPSTTTEWTTTTVQKKEEKRPITLKPAHPTTRRAITGFGSARNLNKPAVLGSQSFTAAPIQLKSEERLHTIERRKSEEANNISKESSKETSSEEKKRRVVPRFTTTTTTTSTAAPTTTRRHFSTRRRSHFTAPSSTTTSTTTTTTTMTEAPEETEETTTVQPHRRAPSTRSLFRDEPVTRVTAKPWKNPNAPKVKRVGESEELTAFSSDESVTEKFEDLFTTTERSTTTEPSTTPSTTTTTTTRAPSTATFRHRATTTRRVIPRVQSAEQLTEKKPLESRRRAFAVRSRAFEGGDSDAAKCQVDVLLIVDSSGSVHNIYDTQKTFLASILEEIDISNHNHRVALIQFAGQNLQKTEWSFDDMSANEQLMKAFGRIRHFTGTTYIGAALHAANRMLDNKRKGVKTLVLLLSDGYSHDNTEIASEEIRALQDVEMFAVSVAPHTNNAELKKITGDESRIFVGKEAEVMREILINKLRCAL